MPHAPVPAARPLTLRFLAALLVTTLFSAALSHAHLPLAHVRGGELPAPVWLAGDDDKGGMGVG